MMFNMQSTFEPTTFSTNTLLQLHQGWSIAKQSSLDVSQLTKASSVNDLPSILINGCAFIKEN